MKDVLGTIGQFFRILILVGVLIGSLPSIMRWMYDSGYNNALEGVESEQAKITELEKQVQNYQRIVSADLPRLEEEVAEYRRIVEEKDDYIEHVDVLLIRQHDSIVAANAYNKQLLVANEEYQESNNRLAKINDSTAVTLYEAEAKLVLANMAEAEAIGKLRPLEIQARVSHAVAVLLIITIVVLVRVQRRGTSAKYVNMTPRMKAS